MTGKTELKARYIGIVATNHHRKARRRVAWLTLAICLVGLWGSALGWLNRADNFYYDLWHRLAGARYQPEHVVIVALDDQSLQEIADPLVCWTPHFARVMDVLRQVAAKVIGLDYLYYASIEPWLKKLELPASHPSLAFDHSFKAQLASGKVVMAANLVEKGGELEVAPPLPEFLAALPHGWEDVGLVNFAADPDGVIRHWLPVMADTAGQVRLTFAQLLEARVVGEPPEALLARLKQSPDFPAWQAWERGRPEALPRIGFAGPPGTFPRISFRRFLSPEAAQSPEILALKDKVVIIGYEPQESQDVHATPYSLGFWRWPGSDMSGPEVHANIVETLLTGQAPRPIRPLVGSLYFVALMLAASFLFFRLPSAWGGLAAVSFCSAVAVLAYMSFRREWLLPVAVVQLGILLSYMGILAVRLAGEERERTRLRHLFGRYVADDVVEKLLLSEHLPDLGGEALHVTVLFSDIRNFTTISEKLHPKEVVEMLNTFFSRACEPIFQQGGTVDKFIGDAIMAVFGAPVPYPDHARRALQAALGLAAAAGNFRDWMAGRFPGSELPEFHIGIGLHTGEAIVGNIGSPRRMEYTSIGDTVNTASRLEGLTKELGWEIVASRVTLAAAGPGVITGQEAVRAVKGRQQSIEVVEILGIADINN